MKRARTAEIAALVSCSSELRFTSRRSNPVCAHRFMLSVLSFLIVLSWFALAERAVTRFVSETRSFRSAFPLLPSALRRRCRTGLCIDVSLRIRADCGSFVFLRSQFRDLYRGSAFVSSLVGLPCPLYPLFCPLAAARHFTSAR